MTPPPGERFGESGGSDSCRCGHGLADATRGRPRATLVSHGPAVPNRGGSSVGRAPPRMRWSKSTLSVNPSQNNDFGDAAFAGHPFSTSCGASAGRPQGTTCALLSAGLGSQRCQPPQTAIRTSNSTSQPFEFTRPAVNGSATLAERRITSEKIIRQRGRHFCRFLPSGERGTIGTTR